MTLGTDTPFFEANESGIGRAVVIGAAIASVIVWTFVALAAMYAGEGLGGSFAMGAYAAFFGGPGFGGMLGAVIYIERQRAVSTKSARNVAPLVQDNHGLRREPEAAGLEPWREEIQPKPAEPVGSAR
jgi:hypothetical protein